MYIIKRGNTLNFYNQLPNGIPNVDRWHVVFRRKGYLISKIFMNGGSPTKLGNDIMNKMQNMKSPKLKLSPNTPPPKKPRRK